MNTLTWAESGRRIDVVKTSKFVSDNLEILILHFLHAHKSLSKHEIIREIFSWQGVSVSPSKMEMIIKSLKERGFVEETKRSLLTTYVLTDKGREIAIKTKTDQFKKL